ncbi:protein kinase domain-containing protein [Streptomyces sp. NPDC004980]
MNRASITEGSDERHDITTTGVLIGTPAYMAPEALAGTFDHRSDLYSLGCVLYKIVTGRRPFAGTSWHVVNQHNKEQPVPLRTLRPDAPVELERLVSQLLAKDPAQRPASAGTSRMTSRSARRKPQQARSSRCGSLPAKPVPPAPHGQTRTPHGPAPHAREKARVVREQRPTRCAFPPASRTVQKVRLRELGGPGQHGGAPRDMYLKVHVVD